MPSSCKAQLRRPGEPNYAVTMYVKNGLIKILEFAYDYMKYVYIYRIIYTYIYIHILYGLDR